MDNNLPKRKHPRLKSYDYSSAGAYFITICTRDRRCIMSEIHDARQEKENTGVPLVGRALAPAVTKGVEYTKYGKIIEEQLLLLEKRYSFLKIVKYVIMPNHIHVLLVMGNRTAGASPRPTNNAAKHRDVVLSMES